MASPSRSGSGASRTFSALLAAALISAITFFLPSMNHVFGLEIVLHVDAHAGLGQDP